MNQTPDTSNTSPHTTETTPQPIQAPPLPYTFKADISQLRKQVGVWRFVIAFILTFVFLIKYGLVVVIVGFVVLALIIFVSFYIPAARSITLTKEALEYRSAFGKVRTVSFADIESAKVFLAFFMENVGTSPRILIGLKNGGAALTVNSAFWRMEDLDKLLAVFRDTQVTVEYYDTPVTYQEIAQQFPTYVSAPERNSRPIILFAVIGTIVFIVGLAVIITVLQQ